MHIYARVVVHLQHIEYEMCEAFQSENPFNRSEALDDWTLSNPHVPFLECLHITDSDSVCLSPNAGTAGLREEFKLLRELLLQYDPAARPVKNLSDVVEVRMGVALFQIRELVSYIYFWSVVVIGWGMCLTL